MKISIAFLFFSLINFIPVAFCQGLPDGTVTTPDFFNEVLKNYAEENSMAFDTSAPDLNVTVPIAVFLVRDSFGNEILGKTFIQQSLNDINSYFKPAGIQFTLSSFEIVGDYNYSRIIDKKIPEELLKKHKKNGVINLYLVDNIIQDKTPVHGFTFYPTDSAKNYIFMVKNVFHENNLASQLGHFFGLLPTHENSNSTGYADNSDCSSTGDLICDTWSDPNISGMVDDGCNYNGYSVDSKFQYYTPSVANFMSNSSAKCKCIFTLQQYRRIQYYYKKYRERCFNKM